MDEGKEEAHTFRILPRAGGKPSREVGGFHFTLLFFFASTSRRARSSPHVGFAIRGSEIEGEEDLETKGFIKEKGRRSQERKSGQPRTGWSGDIRPDELGIGTQGILSQLPLHLFVFRTEIGMNS